MSYLPRMSDTYKEPRSIILDDEEEVNEKITEIVKPASALLNDGTHNPQMILKHYRYVPHPLPVLPGPSVAEEAQQNELYREIRKSRRSSIKLETRTSSNVMTKELCIDKPAEDEEKEEDEEKTQLKRTQSRKGVRRVKSSLGKKKSSREKVAFYKKKDASKSEDCNISTCLVDTKSLLGPQTERNSRTTIEDPEFLNKNDLNLLKREKSLTNIKNQNPLSETNENSLSENKDSLNEKLKDPVKLGEEKGIESTNRSVQCTIFGGSEKVIVIPPVINSLLRALAFLLSELNREEALIGSPAEKKSPLSQIQVILADLCSQKYQKEYSFDTTYSDSKRLEKVLEELQKYVKDIYGDKGDMIDRMEGLKRAFVDLKKKEFELTFLKEKQIDDEEFEVDELVIKENYYKSPEITLQNKRLESEQLLAEVEFSNRELRNYQKSLAEIEWEIKNYQDQMLTLKKSFASKSKTEILGRKASAHKFSNETLSRRSLSRERENCPKKKI